MGSKKWYLSKTLWVNFFVGVVGFAFPEKLGEVFSEANVIMLISLVNIVLRLVTKDGVQISGKK